LVDGEAVILGVDGVPDFNVLHSRKHDDEVKPYPFDILTLDGEDLRPLPLSLRKKPIWRGYSRDGHFRVRQARVPFGGTVLASVAGEQPRGPQFMRITQLLRLPARQRCQPGFRYQRDRRLAERPLCASNGHSHRSLFERASAKRLHRDNARLGAA
jgi:hypothetical protein